MKLSPVSYSFAAAALLGALTLSSAPGCVSSSDNNATGGTASANAGGASGAIGGTSSTSGGSATTNSAGAAGTAIAVACPTPTQELITDFTYTAAATSTSTASFGDYTDTFSGGTFIYPNGEATPAPAYPLVSDVTQGNWHITGTVGDYSGFGLFTSIRAVGCTKIDASAYSGISFTISGSVATGVATTTDTVTLSVGTAANDITAAWLNSHKTVATDADVANFGRCTPTGNRYDGSCGAPAKAFPVTATAMTVTIKWTDLLGGSPEKGITPSEITSIAFILPPPAGAGTTAVTTYPVDLTIDDLKFVP